MLGPNNQLESVPLPPQFPGVNEFIVLGPGPLPGLPINPLDRLTLFSPKQFEVFTYELVHYGLNHKYQSVEMLAGSGDKGRDIIGWKDQSDKVPRHWDGYQCKLYDHPILPSDFWIELGKLVYYTFNKHYIAPDNFFLVPSQGIGPKLKQLLADPEQLRAGLIENWNTHCRSSITKSKYIDLQGDLLQHVNGFDFSVVRELMPLQLIDLHKSCPHHAYVFGGQSELRPVPPAPPSEVAPGEQRYVKQLYAVYSEQLTISVIHHSQLSAFKKFSRHFQDSRRHFYCAESLREFARDSLPGVDYYSDLTDQIYDGIQPTLLAGYSDSFTKVLCVCDKVGILEITSNALIYRTSAADRIGICHQLANEDRITWVDDD